MSRKNQGKGDDVAGLPTVFQFGESSVRTVVKDGDPWFVAKDVCEILDLEDPSVTVSRLDDDQRGKANVCTPGGEQQMLTVSESGLYSLIFTSRKPEAKRFRKWIASEVLPEIRKTGGYGRPEPEFEALSGEYVDYKRWLLERRSSTPSSSPSACRPLAPISRGWSPTVRNTERRAAWKISRTSNGKSARTSTDRGRS
jgi:prophage antirepressor-like protein